MTVLDTLTCDAYGCGAVIADDLGDGWVRTKITIWINPETGNHFCFGHGDSTTDVAVNGEADITAIR